MSIRQVVREDSGRAFWRIEQDGRALLDIEITRDQVESLLKMTDDFRSTALRALAAMSKPSVFARCGMASIEVCQLSDCMGGADIKDAAAEAIRIATMRGMFVMFEFNGITIITSRFDKVEDVVEMYDRTFGVTR